MSKSRYTFYRDNVFPNLDGFNVTTTTSMHGKSKILHALFVVANLIQRKSMMMAHWAQRLVGICQLVDFRLPTLSSKVSIVWLCIVQHDFCVTNLGFFPRYV